MRFILAIVVLAGAMALPVARVGAQDQAESAMAAGRAALEDELYDVACRRFEALLDLPKLSPEQRLEGTLLLARALRGQHAYQLMFELLSAAAPQASGTRFEPYYAYWTAVAQSDLGRFGEALAGLESFESRYPDSALLPGVFRLRGRCRMKMGDASAAAADFAAFDAAYGTDAAAAANLADWAAALRAGGQIEQACAVLERLVAEGRSDAIAHSARCELAELYMLRKAWDKARFVLEPLDAMTNVNEDAYAAGMFMLAAVHEAQSNDAAALGVIEQCSARLSNYALKSEASLRKGRLLLRAGKLQEGSRLVREYVAGQATNPVAATIQLELARTLLDAGACEQAAAEYQNYLEAFSDPAGIVEALKGKGWSLLACGRHAEAAESFERAHSLALDPADRELCMVKAADCLFMNRQYGRALEAYRNALAMFPSSARAPELRFQIAESAARVEGTAAAEKLFLDLAASDPAGPLAARALLRAAELKATQGGLVEALKIYGRCLAVNPDRQTRAEALFGAGSVQYRLGLFKDAIANFEMLVRDYAESPSAEQAFLMRGWCHLMMRDEPAAAAVFDSFARLYPQSEWADDAIFQLGEMDYNRGRFAAAETRFLALANSYTNSPLADSALFWAGRAAIEQGEYRRANESFADLIRRFPDSSKRARARFYQAEALCGRGEFSAAILAYDEIIKHQPDTPLAEQASVRKGDSHYTLGKDDPKRYAEAIQSYETVLAKPDAARENRLNAEYKIGLCLLKTGDAKSAFDRFMSVVYQYFQARPLNTRDCDLWFTRAAFAAAELLEAEQAWRKAVNVYERVIEAGVAASRDAAERINRIRADHWLFFY